MRLEDIIPLSDYEYSVANTACHNALTAFLGDEASDLAMLDFPHDFVWLDQQNKIAQCKAYWCADDRAQMKLTTLTFFEASYEPEADGGYFQTATETEVEGGWFKRFYPEEFAHYEAAMQK
jgi:hypothetical protein